MYLLVRWNHEFTDEPIMVYSELDAQRYEMGKAEIFRGGRLGLAGAGIERDSKLGDQPVPPIDEIAASPEFIPQEISRHEFEAIWRIALQIIGNGSYVR